MAHIQYTESWLELEKSLGGERPMLKGTVAELRQGFDDLVAMVTPQMPKPSDAVSTTDGDVEGIKYRIYTPVEASKKDDGGLLPVGVYTHGGGFVMGNLESEDFLCRAIAEHTPCIIISVDYRLAPEHKLPTQITDTLKIYNWAHAQASSSSPSSSPSSSLLSKVDPTKFFSIGGSAGATIALALANHLVATPSTRPTIKDCVAIVPATLHYDHVPTQYKSIYTSYDDNAVGAPILDKEVMAFFHEQVAVDPKDANIFVVLNEANHGNFPPTYIVTCEADPLRDDGKVLEVCLKKAGVKVKSDYYEGLPHYFWIFPSVKEGKEFVGNLVEGCRWIVGQMK